VKQKSKDQQEGQDVKSVELTDTATLVRLLLSVSE